MEELKKKFTICKDYIDIDKRFISKYKLTPYEMRELVRLLFIKDEATTICSNVIKVLDDFNIKYVTEGIGWRLIK